MNFLKRFCFRIIHPITYKEYSGIEITKKTGDLEELDFIIGNSIEKIEKMADSDEKVVIKDVKIITTNDVYGDYHRAMILFVFQSPELWGHTIANL